MRATREPRPELEPVASRLRAILLEQRVTQSELARHIGKDRDWVNKRVWAIHPIEVQDLKAIARFLLNTTKLSYCRFCEQLFEDEEDEMGEYQPGMADFVQRGMLRTWELLSEEDRALALEVAEIFRRYRGRD